MIFELPSAVFSVCQNCYQKLVFCWHVFGQMHKLQIHKLVSRCDHLNVSTIYSVFDWKEFEILSYRQTILESTEISASKELNALEKAPAQFMALRILSGKGEVQFMLFWKLSGKCHFLLWFCTSNWSETYMFVLDTVSFCCRCLHKMGPEPIYQWCRCHCHCRPQVWTPPFMKEKILIFHCRCRHSVWTNLYGEL